MARLLALVLLLAAAGGAGAKQADARAQALKVPPGGNAPAKHTAVPGVSAAMDARQALRLTFDAAALGSDFAPASTADDVAMHDPATATSPAEELPLPKARHDARASACSDAH